MGSEHLYRMDPRPGVWFEATDTEVRAHPAVAHLLDEQRLSALADAARAVCGLDSPDAESVRVLVHECVRMRDLLRSERESVARRLALAEALARAVAAWSKRRTFVTQRESANRMLSALAAYREEVPRE